MAYKIQVMPLAVEDLEAYTRRIAKDSKIQSRKWLREAWEKIFSLKTMPERFAVIPESAEVGVELREMRHYSHRIIYQILKSKKSVLVLRVWHSARLNLAADEAKDSTQ